MATQAADSQAVFGPADEEFEIALEVEKFNRQSVYNRPGFKPSHTELSHAPVRVTGEIPDDLEGVYVRNGTNPQFARQRVRYHMFDGAAMLHQVQIAGGGATYQMQIHTPAEPRARLTKWVLDLDQGSVVEERVLLDHGYDRPSINLAHLGTRNQYAYLLDEERDGYMGKGALKYDLLQEQELAYFDYGEMHGGEPLFVAKQNATREDDGYLLDLLMGDDKAALIVIDAATMQEVARLHLPQRVPFGVHACWLDTGRLDVMASLG